MSGMSIPSPTVHRIGGGVMEHVGGNTWVTYGTILRGGGVIADKELCMQNY